MLLLLLLLLFLFNAFVMIHVSCIIDLSGRFQNELTLILTLMKIMYSLSDELSIYFLT